MSAIALYWLFLRALMLSFSGLATIPVLREALVLDSGVLTDARLNDAIAIGQVTPGPLGSYVVIVGYFVAGVPGAIAGIVALASPALLAIPIARIVARGESGALQGACSGIVIAACALMLVTGFRLVPGVAPNLWYLSVVVSGALALLLTSVTPLRVILVAIAVGLLAG